MTESEKEKAASVIETEAAFISDPAQPRQAAEGP
jgi:hypothetical protein